ncbi:MAG TPA: SpoIIE family protein phosphatase [Acidimicrobiales bacterium]|nr:SpoIIE family protein phosphatase [Acidimicrobiales bacterium]
MRLRPGVAAVPSRTRCRALVGGFGLPTRRDLDFGRQFVEYAGALDWPDDVVVEDLSWAPHLVLHRLQELGPATVVLVGSVERGAGPAGSVRHYRLDPAQPDPGDVHLSLSEGLAGTGELHHTLRVLQHWGALPADTVIVEVEPADTSFGLGFSEEVGSSIDEVVDAVRTALGSPPDLFAAEDPLGREAQGPTTDLFGLEPPARVADLAQYARLRDRVDNAVAEVRHGMLPEAPQVPGLSMEVRSRLFGTGVHTKGDWYDFVPLSDGWLGIAIGDVAERGLEAAIVMSHLRSAVRAAAGAYGPAPGAVLAGVDRVVTDTGLGTASTLVYLTVHPATGEVRLANAGHCRPLLVREGGEATPVNEGWSPRLGAGARGVRARPETTLGLSPAATLLLYTDGLLTHEGGGEDPLPRLCRAAAESPRRVGELCDHLMSRCLGGRRRGDDASLLVLRVPGANGQP